MAVLQRDELTVRHLPHKLSALTERSNRDLSSLDLIKADPHKPCESAKESDAKRGVQGNDLFIVLKAEFLAESFMAYAGDGRSCTRQGSWRACYPRS